MKINNFNGCKMSKSITLPSQRLKCSIFVAKFKNKILILKVQQ